MSRAQVSQQSFVLLNAVWLDLQVGFGGPVKGPRLTPSPPRNPDPDPAGTHLSATNERTLRIFCLLVPLTSLTGSDVFLPSGHVRLVSHDTDISHRKSPSESLQI